MCNSEPRIHYTSNYERWWRSPEPPPEEPVVVELRQRIKALEADRQEAIDEAARMRRERDLEIAARVVAAGTLEQDIARLEADEWLLERLVHMAGPTCKRETERHVRNLLRARDSWRDRAHELEGRIANALA